MKNIRKKTIKILDKLKKECPDQIIVLETSNGCAELKICNALIYEGSLEIVIGSE